MVVGIRREHPWSTSEDTPDRRRVPRSGRRPSSSPRHPPRGPRTRARRPSPWASRSRTLAASSSSRPASPSARTRRSRSSSATATRPTAGAAARHAPCGTGSTYAGVCHPDGQEHRWVAYATVKTATGGTVLAESAKGYIFSSAVNGNCAPYPPVGPCTPSLAMEKPFQDSSGYVFFPTQYAACETARVLIKARDRDGGEFPAVYSAGRARTAWAPAPPARGTRPLQPRRRGAPLRGVREHEDPRRRDADPQDRRGLLQVHPGLELRRLQPARRLLNK